MHVYLEVVVQFQNFVSMGFVSSNNRSSEDAEKPRESRRESLTLGKPPVSRAGARHAELQEFRAQRGKGHGRGGVAGRRSSLGTNASSGYAFLVYFLIQIFTIL